MVVEKFIPRAIFNASEHLPRSYFLGHHKAGLEQMKAMLDSVDHVIECRDFRVPATSINPLFEEVLGRKTRTIVYTKRDLGGGLDIQNKGRENLIRQWENSQSKVFFNAYRNNLCTARLVEHLMNIPFKNTSLTGYRLLVVGMPNVGKSSLINALHSGSPLFRRNRHPGKGKVKGKVLRTGADPGVTRKIGAPIKLLEKDGVGVYVCDTPGVFMPYIHEPESALKLALCGIIKDSLVSVVTLADYLLFHINLVARYSYQKWCLPTNDISEFLNQFAIRQNLLATGGVPDIERAARQWITLWRNGGIAQFILDDIPKVSWEKKIAKLKNDSNYQGSLEVPELTPETVEAILKRGAV
ncbi:Mitochondrial GTPase [Myotisia sp. PD_48]|nr:Mitochondrial GTPase [Myotisia sp. PD_48]